jgi:hypothetical protein
VDDEDRSADLEIPLAKQGTPEAAAFRRWRRNHAGGSWERFEHEPRSGGIDAVLREHAKTPEQRGAEFRRDHDTGDLSDRERALLSAGIAPPITPRRVVVRFGGIGGVALVVVGGVLGLGAQLVAAGIACAVLGVALFAAHILLHARRDRSQR